MIGGRSALARSGRGSEVVPRVALAVVTRNRARIVERCVLESIRRTELESVELVFVDQSDDDSTVRLLGGIADLRYIRSPPGLSRGRNVAVASTGAPVIVFTDDDVTFFSGWLDRIVELFAQTPSAGAVCGRGRNQHGRLLPGGRQGVYSWPANPFGLGAGFNMALRRSALEDVGPFDTELGAGTPLRAGEDTDMLYRILRAGWTVVCSDRITVVHHEWRGEGNQPRLHYGYGMGAGAQTAKHLRRGDRQALRLTFGEVVGHLLTIVRATLTGRLRVARLQLSWYAGLIAGLVRYPRRSDE